MVEFWTHQLNDIAEKLKVKASGSGLGVGVGGGKRKIESVDSPAKSLGKRVKIETTEVQHTMTVRKTVEYEMDDQENTVKQERVNW